MARPRNIFHVFVSEQPVSPFPLSEYFCLLWAILVHDFRLITLLVCIDPIESTAIVKNPILMIEDDFFHRQR